MPDRELKRSNGIGENGIDKRLRAIEISLTEVKAACEGHKCVTHEVKGKLHEIDKDVDELKVKLEGVSVKVAVIVGIAASVATTLVILVVRTVFASPAIERATEEAAKAMGVH